MRLPSFSRPYGDFSSLASLPRTASWAKFHVSFYRLEDIFARQGFEISWAMQSIWCGDVADLVEPLYELMAEKVAALHMVCTNGTIMPMMSTGKTANARMWAYVGDDEHPYNVFDFTVRRTEVFPRGLQPGASGRCLPRLQRRGCWQRNHPRRMLGTSAPKVIEAEKTAPEITRQAIEMVRALYAVEKQAALWERW